MSTALTPDEIIKILEDLGSGDIDMDEAARRAHVLDTEPGKYRCGTCQRFRAGECHRPSHPPAPVNPCSVRCGDYIERRKSDEALPAEPVRRSSRIFK